MSSLGQTTLFVLLVLSVAFPLGTEAKFRFKLITYHVTIMNWMSGEMLDTHCRSDYQHQDFHQNVAIYGNLTWDFKTKLIFATDYLCDVNISNGHIQFYAFKERDEFIDSECGGRHCVWNATYDGLYLFNLNSQRFFLKATWGPKTLETIN